MFSANVWHRRCEPGILSNSAMMDSLTKKSKAMLQRRFSQGSDRNGYILTADGELPTPALQDYHTQTVEPLTPETNADISMEESMDGATERKTRSKLHRVAIGLTDVTVFILAVIGCFLAPSVSIDAKTLWGLFESGKTFSEAVAEFSLFRVICSILVQATFVLDTAKAKAGLGILLGVPFVSAAAFPL